MLVLSRREKETVVFPSLGVSVEVIQSGKTVRLGIKAPRQIRVVRGEIAKYESGSKSNTREEPTPSPSSKTELRQKIDAANLAIHLAQNQLIQGLSENAETALDQALLCLEELESSLQLEQTPKQSQLVREKPKSYTVEKSQSKRVLLFGHVDTQEIAFSLRENGYDVEMVNEPAKLLSLLRSNDTNHSELTVFTDIESDEESPVEHFAFLQDDQPIVFAGIQSLRRTANKVRIGRFLATAWANAVEELNQIQVIAAGNHC